VYGFSSLFNRSGDFMTYIYPNSDLQDPAKLLGMLGSLWTNVYGGRALVEDRVDVVAQLAEQSHIDFGEMQTTLNRYEIPVHHRENWQVLNLRQSDMNQTDASLWRFDDSDLPTFDGNPEFAFDTPLDSTEFTFIAPDALASVKLITNRITSPSVVLHGDIDFRLMPDRNGIVFRTNPFDNDLITRTEIFEGGVITDTGLTLWLCRPEFDWQYIYEHFGYVIGRQLASSESYRDLTNRVMDAVAGGTALEQATEIISLFAGIPLVRNPVEVVEDIHTNAEHVVVLTDSHVYRHSASATAAVAIGDTVQQGDPLITAYEIIRPGIDDPAMLSAIVLGKGLLSAEFAGELIFRNEDVALEVTGVIGSERVEFSIGGHPLDIELFWDTVHARQATYGQSLFDLLATQGLPLPATINPLEFVMDNILRNNAMVIHLEADSFGPTALGFGPGEMIRRIMPPHTAILLVIELPGFTDSATIDNVADAAGETYDAAEPMSTSIDSDAVDYSCFTAKNVSFTCQ
jgi:hypothetical protein